MDYRRPGSMTYLHLTFQMSLDLKHFDYSSWIGVSRHQWMAQNELSPHQRESFDDRLQNSIEQLESRGLMRVVKGKEQAQVTPEGIVWGQVFRLRLDGTFVVFGSTIDEDAWPVFGTALDAFAADLVALKDTLSAHFTREYTTPARLLVLDEVISVLKQLPNFPPRILALNTYREVAVLACRGEMLRLRKLTETLEHRARDREVIDDTKRNLEHLASILAIPGLADVKASKPRVTDFVNVGILEAARGRPTDEKFCILAAPQLFSPDFDEISEGAFSRGGSFAVGFIDIDHFKTFNTKHLETIVDRDMLPNFMRALEAYCYGRAIAYRQGGDEYLILLRNADERDARAFFDGLQARIAGIVYPETITEKPQVSIGVHVIDGDHEVTVFEAKKLANEAKDKAKKAGRNCVCFSTDPWNQS